MQIIHSCGQCVHEYQSRHWYTRDAAALKGHSFDYKCMCVTVTATLSRDRTALTLSPMGRWLEWVRVERVDGKMYTCMYGIDLEQGGGRG